MAQFLDTAIQGELTLNGKILSVDTQGLKFDNNLIAALSGQSGAIRYQLLTWTTSSNHWDFDFYRLGNLCIVASNQLQNSYTPTATGYIILGAVPTGFRPITGFPTMFDPSFTWGSNTTHYCSHYGINNGNLCVYAFSGKSLVAGIFMPPLVYFTTDN